MAIWKLLSRAVLTQNLILRTVQENGRKLERVLELLEPGPAVTFLFSARIGDTQLGEIMNGIPVNLPDDKQMTLSIKPVDAKGNAALVDGVPVWSVSNTELLTLTPSPDGMSALVVPVGPLGTATVSVKADADLGEGVSEIAGSADIMVTADAAVSIEITAGAVEAQPPTPAATA